MGAWGLASFENDDACDWYGDLLAADTGEAIGLALQAVLAAKADALDVMLASNGLAALEVIAAWRGQPAADFPEDLAEWLDEHPELDCSAVLPLCPEVLRRIREQSELRELWEEAEELEEWLACVKDLQQRLEAALPA